MFTDDYITPMRVEALLELLHECRDESLTTEQVDRLLQPVSKAHDRRPQAEAVRAAAEELTLVAPDKKHVRLTIDLSKQTPRDALLAAIDEQVLSDTQVEPYFALFFSYVLGRGKLGAQSRKADEWAAAFNAEVAKASRNGNQFNKTKVSGLHRWLSYAGLGWYDPARTFQANPYERLRRKLPVIFNGKKQLTSQGFMEALAKHCKELDGGEIFLDANPSYRVEEKTCTLGLAHALVDLHCDKVIRLHCPRDSGGWNLSACEPTPRFDTTTFVSSRIEFIDILQGDQ